MTTLREAAQQALDCLDGVARGDYDGNAQDVCEALRAALAEPTGKPSLQVEPVAWRYKKEGGVWYVSDNEPQYVEQWNDIEEIVPLYTHPAPQRKPQDEPVAWMVMNGICDYQFCRSKEQADAICNEVQKRHDLSGSFAAFHVKPLYAASQPTRQPQKPVVNQQMTTEPVAYRYWSTKWHCWEYSDTRLEFPAVPAGTEMKPLYVAALIKENDGE